MENRIKKITALLIACIELSVINLIWVLLEWFIYGQVQHRAVDDIIGIILIYRFYRYNMLRVSVEITESEQ